MVVFPLAGGPAKINPCEHCPVSYTHLVLLRSGREEQAMLTSLAGLIVVLTMLIYEISGLFDTVKEVFGLVVLWKLPL